MHIFGPYMEALRSPWHIFDKRFGSLAEGLLSVLTFCATFVVPDIEGFGRSN